jgi:hypothetical protein
MIMVRYQGRIESLRLVEEFEDHVMHTAMALGGTITLFRRSIRESPGRIVRGVCLHLCPGQEAMSLLLSPEGVLIPQQCVDEAVFAPLLRSPWCQVTTQCGGVDGHSALIDLLEYMKGSWFPGLLVTDATGYWEHRDERQLRQAFTASAAEVSPRYAATAGFWPASDLMDESFGLIQRLDRLFKRTHIESNAAARTEPIPSRHEFSRMSIEESVLWADYVLRQQERRSQRICRIIEECLAIGMSAEDAAETAKRREGRGFDFHELESEPENEWVPDSWEAGMADSAEAATAQATGTDEPGSGECDEPPGGPEGNEDDLLQGLLDDGASRLLIAARRLMMEIVPRTSRLSNESGYVGVLHQGLLELIGGLSQDDDCEEPAPTDRFQMSFSIVHLRRAIRGASYVHGALAGLRCQRLLETEHLTAWSQQIAEILRSTKSRLHELWALAGSNS